MKYEELCAALIAECEPGCDYIVEITSAYFHETFGSYGECVTYEIFCVDCDDNVIWFNDWYEGQQECYYDNMIKVNDLIRAYKITKQIKELRGWPEDCYMQILKIFKEAGDPI